MILPIDRLHRLWAPAAALIAVATFASAASAQVTSTQQSAIRANCRSDFMSKCSGVTPGGKDALACLQKNVASLSAGCKAAVSATIPAPAPAAAKPAPAAPTPPPAAAAAAPAAAPAPPAAPVITSAPPPPVAKPKRAERPARPPRPSKKPADAPKQAVAAPPPPAPAPAPPPESHVPKAPVVMTAVIGRACLRDLVRHCRDIRIGDGRKIACLTAHADSLTVVCRAAMKITTPLH